nr:tryptophan synthase subunit alpha [Gloeothece citriformis]
MTNSISNRFKSLKARNQCAMIPFITAGDPDLETTAAALKILDRSGADFIELGVPYSDPLADGPVIQAAATRALQKGIQLDHVLDLVATVSPSLTAPIILFTYYNPILNRGIKNFMSQIAQAGAKGLVIPDLPIDEASEVLEIAGSEGIEVILLVAPTSNDARIKAITEKSQGFIYLVSVTGVTGMRSQIQGRVKTILSDIRHLTDKPIGIGFGIKSGEQAKELKEWGADAVIVGSAFVKRLATDNPQEGLRAIEEFAHELKSAISQQSLVISH